MRANCPDPSCGRDDEQYPQKPPAMHRSVVTPVAIDLLALHRRRPREIRIGAFLAEGLGPWDARAVLDVTQIERAGAGIFARRLHHPARRLAKHGGVSLGARREEIGRAARLVDGDISIVE